MACGQQVPHKGLKAFCLFRLNRNKQKRSSLRPQRLCGENLILDKYDKIYKIDSAIAGNAKISLYGKLVTFEPLV